MGIGLDHAYNTGAVCIMVYNIAVATPHTLVNLIIVVEHESYGTMAECIFLCMLTQI